MNKKQVNNHDKLRVLHVAPFYPPCRGGISNLVYNLCKELNKLNLDIHIITSRNIKSRHKHLERVPNQIIEIKSIYLPGWPYSTLKNFSFPADLGVRINSIIKHGDFDVVHVHGHHYPICWIALQSAHKNKIPTVLSLHGTYALNPTKLGGKSTLEDLFNKYIFRNILLKSNVVIGGTCNIIEYAKRYSTSLNTFRIIPNGVDTTRFNKNLSRKEEYRKRFKIHSDKLVVLFVGRFDESKGALNFAKAAKLLLQKHENKFEVIMVGGGNLESEIKASVDGMNGIHIFEWQSTEKIHEFYIAADVFVLPSKFEGLPLTILEAMAANLHIIYSNVGGVHEILRDYFKKNVLTHITPEEISQACISLYKDRIFEVIERSSSPTFNFDWQNIAREINIIYSELQ